MPDIHNHIQPKMHFQFIYVLNAYPLAKKSIYQFPMKIRIHFMPLISLYNPGFFVFSGV